MIQGIGLMSLAFIPLVINPDWLVPQLAVIGVGVGLFRSPNHRALFGSVPRNKMGQAGGYQHLPRQLGESIGETGVVTAFHRRRAGQRRVVGDAGARRGTRRRGEAHAGGTATAIPPAALTAIQPVRAGGLRRPRNRCPWARLVCVTVPGGPPVPAVGQAAPVAGAGAPGASGAGAVLASSAGGRGLGLRRWRRRRRPDHRRPRRSEVRQ